MIDQINELPEDGLKSSPESSRFIENKWISRKKNQNKLHLLHLTDILNHFVIHILITFFYFNIPFQVASERLRLSRGGKKIWWERRSPIKEKPECWGSLATFPHSAPSRPPAVITIVFSLTKLNHLSQNGHY